MRRAAHSLPIPLFPLLFAAAYVAALVATFGSLVRALYSSADVAAAPAIGQLAASAPHGARVVLGHVAWYEALWAEQATRSWPFHRALWEVGPWVCSLVGIALATWATARAAGRLAATLVAVTLGCAGAGLLSYEFPAAIHALTWPHVALLGAFLVWAAGRRRVHPLAWLALGAVTAAGVASDELLLVAGVAPFLLASALLGRRAFAAAAATAAVAGGGGEAIAAAMRAGGVRASAFPIHLASPGQLAPNARVLVHALLYLFGGDVGRPHASARWALGVACALAFAGACAVAVALVARAPRRDPVRAVHVAFWGLAGLASLAAFVGTTVPVDRFSARYVVALGYAVVVLAAVAAATREGRLRAAAVAGACILVAGGTVAVAAGDVQSFSAQFPQATDARALLAWTRAHGLRYGYAGYWDAEPLTWQTGAAVEVFPVGPCSSGKRICPFPFNRISSWYAARPRTPSFVVLDARKPAGIETLVAGLGPPRAVARLGRLTVYAYGYDVASRFGHV